MNGQYRIGDTVMKNWVIRKKLGEGSFGRVYRIERQEFGELYHAALKIITVPQSEAEIQAALEEGMSPQEAEQYFYSMVEEIVREFALMAKVKGTAYVVSYEDHEVIRHTRGLGWDILIRMEELTGLLPYAYAHPFTKRDIIKLGIHMCKGLELCQKYNIIHRDIKPENIFVSENGDFKLGDFGIARTVEKTMSGLSKKGTYNYMAPEVYKGLEYGFSVDIYSLGIVMYRLLNRNRVPFLPPAPERLTYGSREQALARRMSGDPLPMPYYGKGRLGEIVLKAAAYNPRDRYSSPGQMRQELEAILYDEQDASAIYPEGDAIALQENVYATMEQNRLKRQMQEVREEAEDEDDEEDYTEGGTTGPFSGVSHAGHSPQEFRETKYGRTVDWRDDDEDDEDEGDRTVSAFAQRKVPKKAAEETDGKAATEASEEKPAGKSGKGGLIAAVAVIAVVGVIGGAIALGGGASGGANDRETASQTTEADASKKYAELLDQAAELYDSQPQRALELMQEALALYPQEYAAQTDYAYGLYRCGYYDDCISYVEKDLALGKQFTDDAMKNELVEILAVCYYENQDYAGAASYFRLSAAGSEMSESAMRDYAICLARLGSVSEAKDVLAQMRQKGANEIVTRYVEGEVICASGTAEDLAEAEKIFLELLEDADPRSQEERMIQVKAFRSLLQVYRNSANGVSDGKFSQEPIEDTYLKLTRALMTGIVEYGLTYDSTLYEMLGKAAYNVYVTMQNQGETLDQDYSLVSIDAFEQVLNLGVQKDYIYINLYTTHYVRGDYESAGLVLDRMEAAFPKSYQPHAARGILYITVENGKGENERDYSAALEEYNKAGAKITDLDDAGYYHQLGGLIEQLRNGGWLE